MYHTSRNASLHMGVIPKVCTTCLTRLCEWYMVSAIVMLDASRRLGVFVDMPKVATADLYERRTE